MLNVFADRLKPNKLLERTLATGAAGHVALALQPAAQRQVPLNSSVGRPMPRSLRLTWFPLSLLAFSTTARADMVWPALVLETRLLSWWAIGLGLLVEIAFVRWLFRLALPRAAFVTTIANVVSAALGVVLVPLVGLAWSVFPGIFIERLFDVGSFNPFAWTGTFLLATLATNGIECAVYLRGFKLPVRWREFAWLYLANSVSVGFALITVFVNPPRL